MNNERRKKRLTASMLSVALAAAAPFTAFAQDTNRSAVGELFAPAVGLSLGLPVRSIDNLSFGAIAEVSQAPAGKASASELNQQLSNPVSTLWSISNQFNNFELNNGHWNNNWNFQPVLPISLTKDWNLITRPDPQSLPTAHGFD